MSIFLIIAVASFLKILFILFIDFWLCWVFVAVRELGLFFVVVCGLLTAVASRCGAWALGLRASVVVAHGLQSAGSVVVAHGLNCSVACGNFLDHGLNPCPLHWQADS